MSSKIYHGNRIVDATIGLTHLKSEITDFITSSGTNISGLTTSGTSLTLVTTKGTHTSNILPVINRALSGGSVQVAIKPDTLDFNIGGVVTSVNLDLFSPFRQRLGKQLLLDSNFKIASNLGSPWIILGGNWIYGGGQASNFGDSTSEIFQDFVSTDSTRYRVEIDVVALTGSSLSIYFNNVVTRIFFPIVNIGLNTFDLDIPPNVSSRIHIYPASGVKVIVSGLRLIEIIGDAELTKPDRVQSLTLSGKALTLVTDKVTKSVDLAPMLLPLVINSNSAKLNGSLLIDAAPQGDSLYFKGGPGGLGSTASIAFDATGLPMGQNVAARIAFVDDGAYGAHVTFQTRTGSAGTTTDEKMRIMTDGNVLIGTTVTTSNYKLGVAGIFGVYETNGGGANTALRLRALAGIGEIQATRINATDNVVLSLNPSAGNVGIGTRNPLYKLQISAGENQNVTTALGESAEYGNPIWSFKHVDVNYTAIGFAVGSNAIAQVNVPEALVIQRTGNVGIGTITPESKLTVQGVIHSGVGGYKFPDNTVQTSSADTVKSLAVVIDPPISGSSLTTARLLLTTDKGVITGDVTSLYPKPTIYQRGSGINSVQPGSSNVLLDNNTATGLRAVVLSGVDNVAAGERAVIIGGGNNHSNGFSSFIGAAQSSTANGNYSVIAGGHSHQNNAETSFIGAGYNNLIEGNAVKSAIVAGQGNSVGVSCGYSFIGSGDANHIVTSISSSIVGGNSNTVTANYSVVVSGLFNRITGSRNIIGGGESNTLSGAYNVVGGGSNNVINSANSFIGSGYINSIPATFDMSTIGGGERNTASGAYSFIGGGKTNTAGVSASVSGGESNTASGLQDTISGGRSNTSTGSNNSIGGGLGNSLKNTLRGVIAGGTLNMATGDTPTIGGGSGNTINTTFGTIAGGYHNGVTGEYGTVGGGQSNQAIGEFGAVGGGINNVANYRAVVAGGNANRANSAGAVVGGFNNIVAENASYGFIGAGSANQVTGGFGVIAGGTGSIASGSRSFIGGGEIHTGSGEASTIGGGSQNFALGMRSTIAGGRQNYANAYGSAVAGGQENAINSYFGTITGGYSNIVSGEYGIVSGGAYNRANGNYSFVHGGASNVASGFYASIFGGVSNTVSGDYGSTDGHSNTIAGLDSHAYGCVSCTIPAGTQNITLVNCQNFTAPAVNNATYINNTLYAPSIVEATAIHVTGYTLTLADAGRLVPFSVAANCVIPLHSTVAFPIGTVIEIAQEGMGQVTITTADPMITLRLTTGAKTSGQWASIGLRQRSIDEWVVTNGTF